MEQPGAASSTLPDGVPTQWRARTRQLRLVPPAITPIRSGDVAAGLLAHLRGRGRDRFRRDIESLLDADGSATYTSFRRTLAGCFHELAGQATDREDVLIPAFCSSDFPDAIEGVGLEPVRYDVDPDTLSADMASVRSELGPGTLAVVAVNVLGYSSPMAELQALCGDRDAFLVEALGYALGAQYEGVPLGTFGDCAVLNFQQGKPIPVGGGMVVNHDPALAFDDDGRPSVDANVTAVGGYAALSHPRAYYAYSLAKDFIDNVGLGNGRATTHPESKFDVEYAPPFAAISDFQGEIAHRVFERLPDHRRQRADTARDYTDALATCPRVEAVQSVAGLSNHLHVRFPLLAETPSLRDRIQSALGDVGIQATTLYDWPVLDPDVFPGASDLQRSIVTIPTHPYVDGRDRRLIVETVRDVVENASD